MKKIFIVHKVVEELKNTEYVLIKQNDYKGITIIKNIKILNDEKYMEKLKNMDCQWKWFLEEWEVNSDDYFQIVCANDGSKIKAIHIIDDSNPKDGYKCLFQSEKMIVIRISSNMFEISKYTIDGNGVENTYVIQTGMYKDINEIYKIVPVFKIAIETSLKNREIYKTRGYLGPLYAEI